MPRIPLWAILGTDLVAIEESGSANSETEEAETPRADAVQEEAIVKVERARRYSF